MKLIAIPTRDGMVDDHFGHCAYYTVVTIDEQNQVAKQERLDSPEGCGCKSNIASVMQEMGITLMLAGNMGMGAYNKLSAHSIAVIRGCQGKVDDVLMAVAAHGQMDSTVINLKNGVVTGKAGTKSVTACRRRSTVWGASLPPTCRASTSTTRPSEPMARCSWWLPVGQP